MYYTAQGRSYIKTPNALSFAQQHLGCSTLQGVPLEDEGGGGSAGAHFEKAVFGEEMMTSQVSAEMPLSGLTLGLLQDCGWYLVTTSPQEQLWWGKNEGCSFCTSLCSGNFPEFCTTAGAVSCTADYRSGTSCSANTFTNNCLIKRLLSDYMCDQIYSNATTLPAGYDTKGATSRCFAVAAGSATSFGCFPSTCGAGPSLTLTVDGGNITCTASGQVLYASGLNVTCPDLARFCSFRAINKCPTDCAGHGYCQLGGQCTCRYGYSGGDCSTVELCSVNPTPLCASILNATNSSSSGDSRLRLLPALLLLLALTAL